MVVLPAGAQIPPYQKKKGKFHPPARIITVPTVEQSLKEEISRLSLTFESAFSYSIIILSCESSLPPHLKQRPTPLEIGAVIYSMDTGLIDSFHQFIDPGTLPIGFTYEALFHSTETHKIPISQFQNACKNYTLIYKKLANFVSSAVSVDNTVFALKSEQKHVQSSIDWIRRNSRHPWPSRIRVLVLEDLLSELITLSGYEVPVYITNHLIPQHLKYLTYLCCAWHSRQDFIQCAQGLSARLCYAMAALLYKYYPIVWGTRHAPEDTVQNQSYTLASKKGESVVSRYIRAHSAVPRTINTSSPHPTTSDLTSPPSTSTPQTSIAFQPTEQATHSSTLPEPTHSSTSPQPTLPKSGISSQSEYNEITQCTVTTNSPSVTRVTSIDHSSVIKHGQPIKSDTSTAEGPSCTTSVKTNPKTEPTVRPRIGRGYISSYVNGEITKPGHLTPPRRPKPRVRIG